jgi:hypothetical protein
MSGEKAIVTCQNYQLAINKKTDLLRAKGLPLRSQPLRHVELEGENVVIPAGRPQHHRPAGRHRFEPAPLHPTFKQCVTIDDPFGQTCLDVETPHRLILFQHILVIHIMRIIGPRHRTQHISVHDYLPLL